MLRHCGGCGFIQSGAITPLWLCLRGSVGASVSPPRGPELVFQRVPGVVATSVGFCNGKENIQNPTYEAVCSGATGAPG